MQTHRLSLSLSFCFSLVFPIWWMFSAEAFSHYTGLITSIRIPVLYIYVYIYVYIYIGALLPLQMRKADIVPDPDSIEVWKIVSGYRI